MKNTLRRLSVLLTWSVLVLLVQSAPNAQQLVAVDADSGLTVPQLIQRRGYAVEQHTVTTSDRYVLTVFRLPKSYTETQSNSAAKPNKPVVLLMHGLLDSSYTWVLNYRDQSLAYLLADAGYDVWLGNNRGTTWSRSHLDYSVNDNEFWDFTWADMGKFDVPAMVNYILRLTKRPTLSYVGHSQGTMQAFAGFSLNQELAKKVSFFGALAPVAYVGHITSPVFRAMADTHLEDIFQTFGIKEFGSNDPIIEGLLARYACAFVDQACNSILNMLTGPSKNINASRLNVYITQYPGGTSVKNMAHFAQGIRDDTYRQYDYKCSCSRNLPIELCPTLLCGNKQAYSAFDPPNWKINNIKYPRMGFFTASNDWLATSTDVAHLRQQLPAGTIVFEKNVGDYNHLDFTWAFNARQYVYTDLIALIQKYEGQGY